MAATTDGSLGDGRPTGTPCGPSSRRHPHPAAPQIEWDVAVERASSTAITYWITIHNLTGAPVNIEARYAITNL